MVQASACTEHELPYSRCVSSVNNTINPHDLIGHSLIQRRNFDPCWMLRRNQVAVSLTLFQLRFNCTVCHPVSWVPRSAALVVVLIQDTIRTEDLPSDFSWGNNGGVNYVTKNLNQHIPRECNDRIAWPWPIDSPMDNSSQFSSPAWCCQE